MRIKNDFLSGITNSDVAYRLLSNGTMVDAENFFVTTSGGKDIGLGKNVLGNVLVANNQFLGGKSYGVGKDSANNKVYYFVKSTDYDYLMEYDIVTNTNVIVLQSTTGTRLNLKSGEKSNFAKVSLEVVLEIRSIDPLDLDAKNRLQLKYNISRGLINSIIARRTWKHVD